MQWNVNAKSKKDDYPSKRQMNLYYKQDKTTVPATMALYALFAIVLSIGIIKVLVYDYWIVANDLQQQQNRLENLYQQQVQQLKDYNEIKKEYYLYSQTPEESSQVDRIDILNLIDESVRTKAKIKSVSIKENQVLLTFSGVTLSQTADIVKQLESADFVVKTTVDTAVSKAENKEMVDANILIEINKSEESYAKADNS